MNQILFCFNAQVPATQSERRLKNTPWDPANSWDEKLNFAGVEFKSGGTYTVCACDSAVEAPGASDFCRTKDQFKINAGKLHVSGVSCLIEQDRFQRGACDGQSSGGYRCYASASDVGKIIFISCIRFRI